MEINRINQFNSGALAGKSQPGQPSIAQPAVPLNQPDTFQAQNKNRQPVDLKQAAKSLFTGDKVDIDSEKLLWKTPVNLDNFPELKLAPDGNILVPGWGGQLTSVKPDGQVGWKKPIGRSINSLSFLPDGSLLVNASKESGYCHYIGLLACLSPGGDIKWQVDTGNPRRIAHGITYLPDGTILAEQKEGEIALLDKAGKPKWQLKIGKEHNTDHQTAADGSILVISDYRALVKISPEGKIKWKVKPGGKFSSCLQAKDGTLYLVNDEKKLTAISPEGKIKWQKKPGGWVTTSLTLTSDGKVLLNSREGKVWAFDPEGRLKWETKLSEELNWNSIIPSPDGTIYAGGCAGTLSALSPEGKVKWQFKGKKSDILTPPTVTKEGDVFWVNQDKHLIRFNPKGEKIWEAKLDATVKSAPLVTAEGKILVGGCKPGKQSLEQYLYALTDREKAPEVEEKVETKEKPELIKTDDFIIIDGVKLPKRKR